MQDRTAENTKIEIMLPKDGGNIEFVEAKSNTILLNIRPDSSKQVFHWFHFGLKGQEGQTYILKILNADQSEFPCWKDQLDFPYAAVASYDGATWVRVKTQFTNKQLVIQVRLEHDTIFFATFAPYTYKRHEQLLASLSPDQVSTIGFSVNNKPISLVTIGTPSEKVLKCWIIARQHPGEPMAEWFMEGLIQALSKEKPKDVIFYLIPNMNPDGTALGNLRTNAMGYDLNRSWDSPDAKNTPEVHCVLRAMKEKSVDFFMDVHGDEQIPYVFLDTGINSKSIILGKKFIKSYEKANKHVQSQYGYFLPKENPPKKMMRMAHYAISETFDCVSLLLEMPYKDDKNNPEEKLGWSPEKSKNLGQSLLEPLNAILPQIRNRSLVSVSDSKQTMFAQPQQISHTPRLTNNSKINCSIL